MRKRSPVLSISMLVSGQKEDMEKSLQSLCCFKEAFPCEIILVDTGCNREQRDLAEKYADKMVDFSWCNDFAAARNAGLKEAAGQWFMYLDDDEWFEDPQEIIRFFTDGEYRNYNSASYMVRSYINSEGTSFESASVTRMVKREPETRFVGKIHEYLFPYKAPNRHFNDFVHHYGYVYKNEEEKRRHAYRNIEPLLEMRQEAPGDPRWTCQLAQEYFSIEQYQDVVKVCTDGLEQWKKKKAQVLYGPFQVGAVYGFLLIALESQRRFHEEAEWLGKALAEKEMPEVTRAFFYLAGVRLYGKMQKPEECREYTEKYLSYYDRLKDNEDAVANETVLITSAVFQDTMVFPAMLLAMPCLILTEDYGLTERAFFLPDWSDRRLLHQENEEKAILAALCSVEYHPLWVRILQTLVARADGMQEMYRVFLETEIRYKQETDEQKARRLHRLVAGLEYDHRYIVDTKIIWAEQSLESGEQRKETAARLAEELFTRYTEQLLETRAEVWRALEGLDIAPEAMLLQINYSTWKEMIESWADTATVKEIIQWEERIFGWRHQADIRYEVFFMKSQEAHLRKIKESGCSLKQTEQMLWRYADQVLAVYRFFYKDFLFKEMPEGLPGDGQLALKLKELQHFRAEGDDKSALECLRKSLHIYPPLTEALCTYAEAYRNDLIRQENEKREFAQLVLSLKKEAGLRIEKKEYQVAKEILRQLRQCVPEDGEVGELAELLKDKFADEGEFR